MPQGHLLTLIAGRKKVKKRRNQLKVKYSKILSSRTRLGRNFSYDTPLNRKFRLFHDNFGIQQNKNLLRPDNKLADFQIVVELLIIDICLILNTEYSPTSHRVFSKMTSIWKRAKEYLPSLFDRKL